MDTKKEALAEFLANNLKVKELHRSKEIVISTVRMNKVYKIGKVPSNEKLYKIFFGEEYQYNQQPSISDKKVGEALEELKMHDNFMLIESVRNKKKIAYNTIRTKIEELEEENKKLDKIKEAMKLTYNYGTKEKVYDIIKEVLNNE